MEWWVTYRTHRQRKERMMDKENEMENREEERLDICRNPSQESWDIHSCIDDHL